MTGKLQVWEEDPAVHFQARLPRGHTQEAQTKNFMIPFTPEHLWCVLPYFLPTAHASPILQGRCVLSPWVHAQTGHWKCVPVLFQPPELVQVKLQ